MKTITLAAAKGGVGKTTLATAAILDQSPLRVALADLDPQGSLTRWWNDRALPQPMLVDMAGRSLRAVKRELRAGGVDLFIMDCPPSFSSILQQAIAEADLVLVPVGASPLDMAAVASTSDMALRAGGPHRFVLNRPVFRSRIAGETVSALRERGGLLWPPVHQRVPIVAAMSAGRTVLENEPGGAAAREIWALWKAVRMLLGDMPAASQDRGRGGRRS